jgi:hypothetical protein
MISFPPTLLFELLYSRPVPTAADSQICPARPMQFASSTLIAIINRRLEARRHRTAGEMNSFPRFD